MSKINKHLVSGSAFDELRIAIDNNKPKFNKGKCKNGCNCIEIAEYDNGGNPVKNYECLGG